MTELNLQQIINCFKLQGLNQNDYLKSQQLHKIMSKLNGAQFDIDIHNQLWDECKINSNGQIKAQNYIQVLLKAQKILTANQKQVIDTIIDIQSKIAVKKKTENLQFQSKTYIRQMEAKLNQLKETKIGYQADLQIIRHPFTRNFTMADIHQQKSHLQQQLNQSPFLKDQISLNQEQQNLITEKPNFSILFYLVSILVILEIPIIFHIPHYHNIVFFTFIYYFYLFKHLNKNIIKFNLYICLFTIFVDLVWFIILAKKFWNMPIIWIFPSFMSSYFKLCIFLCAVILIGKGIIVVLLFLGRNYGQIEVIHSKILGTKITLGAHYLQKNPIVQIFPNKSL